MRKYKATAMIQWEIEFEDHEIDLFKIAKEQIQSLLPENFSVRISRINKCKNSRARITLGEFAVEDVLPYITLSEEKKEYKIGKKQYLVKMNSQRYFVFAKNLSCVACGLTGTKMLLERNPNDVAPHFNLYAEENNELVLMTKDHIYAKSRGGKDRYSNYQTMCSICNNIKGSSNLTLSDIHGLRKIHNQNKHTLKKKELWALLSEEKKKLEKPWPSKETVQPDDYLIKITCDLSVIYDDDKLIGVPMHENSSHETGEQIASIKSGTYLKMASKTNDQLVFQLNDNLLYVYFGLTDF